MTPAIGSVVVYLRMGNVDLLSLSKPSFVSDTHKELREPNDDILARRIHVGPKHLPTCRT
jgi:hypothetical protein